jgi:ring-1,2-phenylacetyl-CoA epoxidase subunit PaaE
MSAVTFHPLTVTAVERLTDDSVRVTFAVPPGLEDVYDHRPGQHLILRRTIDDHDVRRSYSICSPTGSADLQVGIKRLDGGAFSTWANTRLEPGDVIESTPPSGEFIHDPDAAVQGRYAAIAAGSGITPVLSIIASTLRDEPNSEFTLVYGNRDGRSVMFLDEIDALKGRYPDRFMVIHVLSREGHTVPLFEGRIDADKLDDLFGTVLDPSTVDEWFLCGPRGVVDAARSVLAAKGIDAASVHDELFYAGGDGPLSVASDDLEGSTVVFTLHGRTSTVVVDPHGAPILDHVLSVRPEGPFSCRSAACASCRARVVSGEVSMDRNWSLNEEEVAAGQILTCQSHPVSEAVEITYDL